MEDELFGYVGCDLVDDGCYVYYDITLKQDFNGRLKTGMYFPAANFNTNEGIMELIDEDGIILHRIKLRLEVVSIEHL